MQTYTTVQVYRRAAPLAETHLFKSSTEAARFCREEVKWESTKLVICRDLDFEQDGDFACFDNWSWN